MMLATPRVVIDLKQANSTEQVQNRIQKRAEATRSRLILNGTTISHSADLMYRGSRSVVLVEESIFGSYQFVYVYNSKTGEIDRHEFKYTPAPKRIFASVIIFALFYWLVFPVLDRRLRSNAASN
jgi:hypothetical protein